MVPMFCNMSRRNCCGLESSAIVLSQRFLQNVPKMVPSCVFSTLYPIWMAYNMIRPIPLRFFSSNSILWVMPPLIALAR